MVVTVKTFTGSLVLTDGYTLGYILGNRQDNMLYYIFDCMVIYTLG